LYGGVQIICFLAVSLLFCFLEAQHEAYAIYLACKEWKNVFFDTLDMSGFLADSYCRSFVVIVLIKKVLEILFKRFKKKIQQIIKKIKTFDTFKIMTNFCLTKINEKFKILN